MVKINLKGVSSEFPLIPAGRYAATLDDVKYYAKSKSSGMPTLSCTFTIKDDADYEGQKVFKTFSLQEKAFPFIKAAAIALGGDPNDLEEEVEIDEYMKGLIGNECIVEVGTYIDSNTGKERNDVKSVKDSGEW